LRRIGVPVTWHCIAVCIEFRLNVSQALDGLSGRWFYFKLQLRRRSVNVQDMRLTGIPNSKTGHRNNSERETNGDQPDEKPKSSCAAPVKREKNQPRRNNTRHQHRDGSGKIASLAFKRGDVKSGCEGRSQSEAEK
jgi:hypothetical protein